MIKNIIFDIGGVLLEYNPKIYLDKLNIEEEKRKNLNNIIFHNQKWRDCLNGHITNEELIKYLSNENPKYKHEIKKILGKDNLKYMLPPKRDMIEYYKERGHFDKPVTVVFRNDKYVLKDKFLRYYRMVQNGKSDRPMKRKRN